MTETAQSRLPFFVILPLQNCSTANLSVNPPLLVNPSFLMDPSRLVNPFLPVDSSFPMDSAFLMDLLLLVDSVFPCGSIFDGAPCLSRLTVPQCASGRCHIVRS